MKRKPRPFLAGYHEKTEVVSKQIRQRLEQVIFNGQFKKKIAELRETTGTPTRLAPENDYDFSPDFLEKIHGGKKAFFNQPITQIVLPQKSQWFLAQSTETKQKVYDGLFGLLRDHELPKTQVYFYWLFNHFLYKNIPEAPRSGIDFVNLKLPAQEALTTGEKQLLKSELRRARKDDPWAGHESAADIRTALKLKGSGRPIWAIVAGHTFVPAMKKEKGFQKKYAAARQALSRLKKRQERPPNVT